MLNFKKNIIIKSIAVLSVLSLIVGGFIYINSQITYSRRCTYKPVSDNINYVYQVESVEVNDDSVIIKGWFFELKSVRNVKCENNVFALPDILLYNINSSTEKKEDESDEQKKGVLADVEWGDRKDINTYFNCEFDYTHCGFLATFKKTEIDVLNEQYQLIFKCHNNSFDISGIETNIYIDKGSLCYVDPKKINKLSVKGTDLETVVDKGVCLVCCPENHIYVYQLGYELYWIADEGFAFEKDGGTYIQYQIDTTQINRLPIDRIENGWYWSNIGDNFENNEISDIINCGKYRVCKRLIPMEYSVTMIVTGYYIDGEWMWQSYFRPIYEEILA